METQDKRQWKGRQDTVWPMVKNLDFRTFIPSVPRSNWWGEEGRVILKGLEAKKWHDMI